MKDNRPTTVRDCVRILLINDQKKLLLMSIDDPKATFIDEQPLGKYWFPIGGKIENGEGFIQATLRELHEETGLEEHDISLGPIVWEEKFEMILHGTLTYFQQKYIVIRTSKSDVTAEHLSHLEKSVFKGYEWFSIEDMKNCPELIYPMELKTQILQDILDENFPEKLIKLQGFREKKVEQAY